MKISYQPVLIYVFKLILGIAFIWASYIKIQDPAGFAKILYGYGVFPAISINLIAIVLPFIELVAGFSILMRFFPRSALLIINGLLGMFILLISFNLLRGHQFDCGCFSVTGHSGMTATITLLIRDILLLGAGIYVWKKSSDQKTINRT